MKIYISGKITGLSLFQAKVNFLVAYMSIKIGVEPYPKFDEVISPFDLDHSKNETWFDYMRTDLKALSGCQAIYMLDNWKTSKGAWIELIFSIITFKRIYFQ